MKKIIIPVLVLMTLVSCTNERPTDTSSSGSVISNSGNTNTTDTGKTLVSPASSVGSLPKDLAWEKGIYGIPPYAASLILRSQKDGGEYATITVTQLAGVSEICKMGGEMCFDEKEGKDIEAFWANFLKKGIETSTGSSDRLGNTHSVLNPRALSFVLAGYDAYHIRSIKKIGTNAYLLLSSPSQFEALHNIAISYIEYESPGVVFAIRSDVPSPAPNTPELPVPDKYYDTLAIEFQAGKFSDKKMDEWYQAILTEAKNIKETTQKNGLIK